MHIRTAALAALAALVAAGPAAALAQDEEAPRWTIGAGVSGFVQLFATNASPDFFLSSLRTTVPVPRAFVERRLDARSWLVVGLSGNVERETFDPPPLDASTLFTTVTEFDQDRVSLLLGIRRVVTRPGTILDVSLLGSVEGGYGRFRQEFLRQDLAGSFAPHVLEDRGRFFSASAGIAVERVLAWSLALRISTPLVGVSWSRLERTEDDLTRDGSTTGVSVGISPALELRLAF